MIQRIKDLATLSKQLGDLNDKVAEYKDDIETLKDDLSILKNGMASLKGSIESIQGQSTDSMNRMRTELSAMQEGNEQFRKAIYDFTVLKKDMQKEITQRFDAKLKEELIDSSKELRHAVNDYNALRASLTDSSESVEEAARELTRLKEVMKAVKNQDFELVRFTKQVEQQSKEKLELLRKIDNLERLVSRLRRK